MNYTTILTNGDTVIVFPTGEGTGDVSSITIKPYPKKKKRK